MSKNVILEINHSWGFKPRLYNSKYIEGCKSMQNR